MKIKVLERTANVAWSPKEINPIYLAAGTAAQQLDASFSTNAALEIYSLNLTEPGLDLKLHSTAPSNQRFHKIIWGSDKESKLGTIVAGCDGGIIKIFNASKLLNNEQGLIKEHDKHTGPVHALDFNPFQHNLFASGASESEIFIWDMNNLNTPMTPGSKSQPLEDVLSLSWNRQVQHILASTFASKCVIWDLKKNEPIIKLTDTVSRVHWKVVAWHPEIATQLALASEEDHSPVIQIWDLRFATSPLKTLENHQRGVLSIAWCLDDSDLLVSCGKDERILCWNPNSNQSNGEVISEVAKTNQWNFDVQWCPRNPAVIACPSFDGHVSIYSLMGGQTQQFQTTNKIADSFPGMDGYVQAPPLQKSQVVVSADLTKPPKWLKKPVGASFAFGGKLVTFEYEPAQTQNGNVMQNGVNHVNRSVQISQVITELELVDKSQQLESALEQGDFISYCLNKADESEDQHKKYIWHYLKANFDENPRAELLNLLGYKIDDVNNKLYEIVGGDLKKNAVNDLANDMSNLNRIEDFDLIANSEAAKNSLKPFKIQTGNDTEGLITQALIMGNVEAAVELCFKAKRYADALIIAMTGGSDLLIRTQRKYLEQSEGYVSTLISALVSEDWASIINNCDLSSWKEALAATLTHASDDDLPSLCEQLGNRLEMESKGNPKVLEDAQLCYICSGSFEKLVSSWSGKAFNSTGQLQELIELVMFLQKAIERQGRHVQVSGALAELLSKYASILASQGKLQTALTYLGSSSDPKVATLRDRLFVHLGQKPGYGQSARNQSRQNSIGPGRHSFGARLPGNITPGPMQQNWQVNAQPQPVASFTPGPPPSAPSPKPFNLAATASAAPSTGIPSRKYVLDPSVASNNYDNMPMNNMVTNQPFMHPYQNQTPYQPMEPAPLNPAIPSMNPVPLAPALGFSNNFNGPPPPTVGFNQQHEPAQPSYNSPPMAPGWNDPPVLNKPLKSQTKVENHLPSTDPITHPIFGAAPTQQPMPNTGYRDMMPAPPLSNNQTSYNQEILQPSYPQQMPFQQPGKSFNYNAVNFNQNAVTPDNVLPPPEPQVKRAESVPVEKPPIPEEHMHMKTVFDELKKQCSCQANNPQLKRKLEDVGKKLESLYDMLRDNKLSSTTLSGLHQIVQMIQNGNYNGGLSIHCNLVSGPDFAMIASFMPGIKVLLQCAMQLQVYLR